jgi:hypothetical protein
VVGLHHERRDDRDRDGLDQDEGRDRPDRRQAGPARSLPSIAPKA